MQREVASDQVAVSLQVRMDSRCETEKGNAAVISSGSRVSKMEEALQSAAFLVCGLADGAGILSDELSDAVRILAGELDALGLLDQYRGQKTGRTV
jgi:hypothetical protein